MCSPISGAGRRSVRILTCRAWYRFRERRSGLELVDQPLKAFAAAARATDHHRVRAGHACLGNQEVKPPPHGIPAVHDLDLVSR
jgi:hypothetical protein